MKRKKKSDVVASLGGFVEGLLDAMSLRPRPAPRPIPVRVERPGARTRRN